MDVHLSGTTTGGPSPLGRRRVTAGWYAGLLESDSVENRSTGQSRLAWGSALPASPGGSSAGCRSRRQRRTMRPCPPLAVQACSVDLVPGLLEPAGIDLDTAGSVRHGGQQAARTNRRTECRTAFFARFRTRMAEGRSQHRFADQTRQSQVLRRSRAAGRWGRRDWSRRCTNTVIEGRCAGAARVVEPDGMRT